ncbi:MAG: ferredoxin:CoB-CoM heterodisulfide reductase subunit HdrB [Methanobacteriaceae archaeon]
MKFIPDKNIQLFRSCLVSVEYPGVESSTKYVFDKLGIEYIVDENQSCCTGLGHYSDVFDQFTTSAIGARNFNVAQRTNHQNIATMCATCYAINKKVAKILNNRDDIREEINEILEDSGLEAYKKDSTDPKTNIFHIVEILYNKKEEIANKIAKENLISPELSKLRVASHHACHYCKVQYKDTVEGVRNPKILDELARSCGFEVLDWYDQKRTTCGAGFRQRFINKDLSLAVTGEKLTALHNENVDILLHMCPNCQMQFDRYQPYLSKELNLDFKMVHLHISQFIALALGADPYKVLGVQTHSTPIDEFLKKTVLNEEGIKEESKELKTQEDEKKEKIRSDG